MRTALPIAVFASLAALSVAALPVTVVIQFTSATPLDTSRDGSSSFPSARYDPVVSSSMDFPAVSLPINDQAPVLVRRDTETIQEMKRWKVHHEARMDEAKHLARGAKTNSEFNHQKTMYDIHSEIHHAFHEGIQDYDKADRHDKRGDKLGDSEKAYGLHQQAQALRDRADEKIRVAKEKLRAYSLSVVHTTPRAYPQGHANHANAHQPAPLPQAIDHPANTDEQPPSGDSSQVQSRVQSRRQSQESFLPPYSDF